MPGMDDHLSKPVSLRNLAAVLTAGPRFNIEGRIE